MTRFAIDAATAHRLIREGRTVAEPHRLVGPAVLRSDVLDALYREARGARLARADVRELLDRLAQLPIRLLGDRVSRAAAWDIAVEQGWERIGVAEYLAVARLQADVLVTDDPVLIEAAEGMVVVAPFDDLPTSADPRATPLASED
ncbi:hypothetical protein [Microbacterium sp. 10M-3C3]|jgi:predicted nucleic acid-binding protein|uniref:type II toxin-antitoxin system VapC family toxin n=1 Tax=Microbacterium sp. 10M-3C3 TaxID=2483401 RepID=UPI000F64189D|nr:hypothetical protein [Microbacterium sp. 10M-3C3]